MYVALSPIWGPAAEAAFHLEYATPPTKGLNFLPEIVGIRTQRPQALPAPRASGRSEVRQVRFVEPSTDVWSRLRACESSDGRSSSNGLYHGYFQFRMDTWRAAGGTGHPMDHSYEHQRAIAQSWQQRAGWGQWPACARKLGLR